MSRRIPNMLLIIVAAAVTIKGALAQEIDPRRPVWREWSRIGWIDLGRIPMGWGLIRCATDVLPVRWERHFGFEGMLPAGNSPDPSLYLAVAPGFLRRPTGTFFLAIQYWDKDVGPFQVQYMRHTNSATPTQEEIQTRRFYTGATRQWQWENLRLTDSSMQADLPYGADICLIPPGTPVRRVLLSRRPLGEVDRVQPWGSRKQIAEIPKGLTVFIRPSAQEQLVRDDETGRREQWLDLFASWGAEGVVIALERNNLIAGGGSRQSPIVRWPGMFQHQRVKVLLELTVPALDRARHSIWDSGEIKKWGQAARVISRLSPARWLSGVIIDLSEIIGMGYSPSLEEVWSTPPVAEDFRRTARQEIGTLSSINRRWGTTYRRYEEILPFRPDQASSVEAALFVRRWIESRQASLLDAVLRRWKSLLPRTRTYIRVPYRLDWGMADFARLSRLAKRYGTAILVSPDHVNPSVDPRWVLLAGAARRAGVDVGLDLRVQQAGSLSAAVFALSSEGGHTLILAEEHLAQPGMLAVYTSAVRFASGSRAPRPTAVLFPSTLRGMRDYEEFARHFALLRDAISVDLLTEGDLLNPSTMGGYRVLVHIGGDVWSKESLEALEAWVRSGGLLLYAGDRPMRDEDGRMEIMTRLFPLRLESGNRTPTLSAISRRSAEVSIRSTFRELRAYWLKEVGLGYTLYVPGADESLQEYVRLAAQIALNPSLISPRIEASVEGDGLIDNIFSAQTSAGDIMLNMNPNASSLTDRFGGRAVTLPAWGLAQSPQ